MTCLADTDLPPPPSRVHPNNLLASGVLRPVASEVSLRVAGGAAARDEGYPPALAVERAVDGNVERAWFGLRVWIEGSASGLELRDYGLEF